MYSCTLDVSVSNSVVTLLTTLLDTVQGVSDSLSITSIPKRAGISAITTFTRTRLDFGHMVLPTVLYPFLMSQILHLRI